MTDLNDYVTIKEAAQMIGRSKSTVYTYLLKGRIDNAIPPHQIGQIGWLIPKQWIEDFLNGNAYIEGVYRGIYAKYRKKRK